jgi:hypothetical protein
MNRKFSRRSFLGATASALGRAEPLLPLRALTNGPKFHEFDYYDKLEFDPSGPYMLGMEVNFEYRSPHLPGNRSVLNDTYRDKDQKQDPYLYDTRTDKRYPLGHFQSPEQCTREWRCNTHPRYTPDGRGVVIDASHGGNGRQFYPIDISGIVSETVGNG